MTYAEQERQAALANALSDGDCERAIARHARRHGRLYSVWRVRRGALRWP